LPRLSEQPRFFYARKLLNSLQPLVPIRPLAPAGLGSSAQRQSHQWNTGYQHQQQQTEPQAGGYPAYALHKYLHTAS
jgi:hypothetical protein